ncbi:ATP synthase F1 subunit gamma [Aliarcobacter cryaerophilus]|jgi:F-type H+-transporting ATPase subunit gamma|uniref:ATP synthase F1 subunit gamma n=1 Tax=Aliarcobacter cryaerophilus TaxID=28198 RepID=UPI00082697E6|nr:ATP synthase F1 subunit gamma [Aliarcobacter cryaerophilus]OQA76066.1 MAG: ATP synthase gamma chain [Candidatus Dependentiae bacterium ADurb.Bin246]MCT7405137.1 ATP synthase F1 subunit gamma [Aliarcobacter cryaerophilus]MCT7468361.1 ATP synthase F1 subunit gamma [Aliarcobacter cryaerophilus]MCT7472259.1 ATP synthase F1 subunit gamma [Aliarcobacter cryaerophilus]MCT7494235.1 ATP synthase F1 subunit gamma [Aliarcobacter cryaerophilus]
MANLKEIKIKINSVKNTQKTTKAMKLVSSAKLTRTRQLSEQSRSYANKINEVLSDIATRVSKVQDDGNIGRAFIQNENPKTVDIVFVTADKGLCGGFNVATIKTVSKLINEYEAKGAKVRLRAAGKKGVEFFSFQGATLEQKAVELSSAPTYEKASNYIKLAVEDFKNELTDKVIIVYNGFLNMLTQEIRVKEILPVSLEKVEISETTSMLNIEPDDDDEVLKELTDKYIDFNMYYALIDSLAAEHSARMQAMEAASKNAKEKVNSLTVEYNKARQAAITTELIEIISGVEALK